MCREKDSSKTDCNSLTAHVVSWFIDLNSSREYIIYAGMSGGGCVPKAIGYSELAAWSDLTGYSPAIWELKALRAMDQAWRTAYDQQQGAGTGSAGRQHQGLGEYCKGAEVEGCRATFGDQLERVCATCPN